MMSYDRNHVLCCYSLKETKLTHWQFSSGISIIIYITVCDNLVAGEITLVHLHMVGNFSAYKFCEYIQGFRNVQFCGQSFIIYGTQIFTTSYAVASHMAMKLSGVPSSVRGERSWPFVPIGKAMNADTIGLQG